MDPTSANAEQSFEWTPEFAWTCVVAAAMVLQVLLPSFLPEWFAGEALPVAGRGVLGVHFVLITGLLAGWRWARYVTLAYLTLGLGFWVALADDLLPPDPSPMAEYLPAWATLFVLHGVALGLLAVAAPVRRYFQSGESGDGVGEEA